MKLDIALTDLAADQDGLVTTDQLRDAGVTTWRQQRMVADGLLRRIAPRVYAIRGAPDTHRRRLRAGLLCLGERSWVSFEAAAALHGLDRSDRFAVEFTIDRGRRPAMLPFVVHVTTRLQAIDQVVVDGLRTMSATRTVFDLALARAHPRRIEAAIDSAVRLQLSSPEVLARRLADLRGSGRWGCRRVEEMITDSGGHTMLERRFLELVREAGLPRPRTQVVFRSGRSPRGTSRLPVRPRRRGRGGVRPEGPRDARANGPVTPNGATSCRTSVSGSSSTPGEDVTETPRMVRNTLPDADSAQPPA